MENIYVYTKGGYIYNFILPISGLAQRKIQDFFVHPWRAELQWFEDEIAVQCAHVSLLQSWGQSYKKISFIITADINIEDMMQN